MTKLFNFRRSPDEDGYDYIIVFSKDFKSKGFLGHYMKALGDIKDKKLDPNLKLWRVKQDAFNYLKRMEIAMNNPNKPHDINTCRETVNDPIFSGNPFLKDNSERRPVNKVFTKKNDFKISQICSHNITDYSTMGSNLKLEPYDYQKEIIKFCLSKENALIVAPCGAGKTPMVLGIYDEAKRAGKIKGPGIIVVKASLKNQWKEEVKKFTDYKPIIVNTLAKMKKDKQAFEDQFKDNDLYILNYEALRDEKIRDQMKKVNADFMACDEIQYIKDSNSKRAKAIYEFNDIKFKIGATATPVMKNPLDIFGIFKFINPELFPKKGTFGDRYVSWITFGGYVRRPNGAKNEAELNEKIFPYMIIKSKEEISEQLPSLHVLQKTCVFTPKQQKMSDRLINILSELHEQEQNVMKKLAKTGAKSSDELKAVEAQIMMYQNFAQELAIDEKLLACSTHPKAQEFLTGGASNKIEIMLELIKEIVESGEKVAIFSRFVRIEDIIKDYIKKDSELKGYKIATVNGSMDASKRYDEIYNKFTEDDNCKILLCSDAAAEGVNLSKCRYIIEMELAQSYALQTQRHGRIERADSVHDTVYVYQLLYENSYDDIAMKIVNKKRKFDKTIVKGLSEND